MKLYSQLPQDHLRVQSNKQHINTTTKRSILLCVSIRWYTGLHTDFTGFNLTQRYVSGWIRVGQVTGLLYTRPHGSNLTAMNGDV